ncbi:hypothetical protein [Massilia sp. DWR3-1-1]|uniref:hypothetical protein n=1 Tax=Massilia sp. DWR3-1-1 TaxID=2804559 RepID=UPI003CEB864D
MNGAALMLRWRLWLVARGPLPVAAVALPLAGVLALAVLLPLRTAQSDRRVAALSAAAMPAPLAPVVAAPLALAAPAAAGANLAQFQQVLGERRDVEQQVGTLFALAAKSGIVLNQGEYKSASVREGGFGTYQVNLPVRGSYGAIWQFAMAALRAIPFASLDDISFKRDSIGQPGVEARVRLTLYLQATP